MAARINHIASISTNPMAMGTLYETLFGLSFEDTTNISDCGEVLSDGHVTFHLQPRIPGHRAGLDHFGIGVDDLAATLDAIRTNHPSIGWIDRPSSAAGPGYLSHDPAGSIFALSQNPSPEQTPSERSKPVNFGRWSEANPEDRYLHHYAIRTRRADECAEFYEDLFGFSRGSGRADNPNHYLSDGRVTLMLIPWHITDYADISVTGRGPDHIGFKVEDAEVVKQEIEDFFSRFSPGQAPLWLLADNKYLKESQTRAAMIEKSCPVGSYQFTDKDGVFVVIGDKTFEEL